MKLFSGDYSHLDSSSYFYTLYNSLIKTRLIVVVASCSLVCTGWVSYTLPYHTTSYLDGADLVYCVYSRATLSGEALDGLQVKFESRVERVMIDVSLEIRKEHPGVVLSACTRLPDVIIPYGAKYGKAYDTGGLTHWPHGERGIS